MEKQTMGSFIAALRRAAGMTQREMAERLNVSDKAVSRWERDESAPDLTLIPVIADLFGITADELIRGRRNNPIAPDSEQEDRRQARDREMSERSIRTLAGKELAKLGLLSLIAVGIGFAGVVVAFLCNFVFLAGKLGFFLSLFLFVPAVIMEIIVTSKFLSSVDEEGYREITAPFRAKGIRRSVAVFAALAGMGGSVIPFLSAPVYTGYSLTWELGMETLLFAAIGVGLILLIYFLGIRPSLVRKGILAQPNERDFARRRVMKKYALILAILLVVTFVGAAIFNSIDVTTYARAEVFHDFDSFVEYMEQPMWEDGDALMIGEAIISPLPDDAGDLSEEEEWYRDTITDAEGNVLCSYLWRNQAVNMIRPSEGGLPIYVYTGRAINAAYDLQQTVNVCFVLLAIAEAAICGILCYRKCRTL